MAVLRCYNIAGSLHIALGSPIAENLVEQVAASLPHEEWEKVHTVILDLEKCDRLSSFEMGILALLLQDYRLSGRRFRLRHAQPQLRQQLFMVGFNCQATIEDNGQRAITDAEASIPAAEIWRAAQEACEAAAALRNENKALKQQVEHLEKVSELGQIAAGVAHEFNNILGIMRGYAELASNQLENGEMVKEAFKVVIESCERAKKVTDALLNLARRKPMHKQLTDINAILQEQLRLLASECLASKVEVRADFAPEAAIVVDASQIEQVFLNLLTNAIQAMPRGGTLSVRTRVCGEVLEIEVADTGEGIAPENLARIFTPFFTTKGPLGGGKSRGSGLGLSVSRAIVANHGGSIAAQSEVGKGSVFTVMLPRRTQEIRFTSANRPAVAVATGDDLVPLRILVVDDESKIRDLLKSFLQKKGHTVYAAANGEEALAACEAGKPDLVFLDILMPGMNGGDLLLALRQRYKDMPVAVITGQAGKPLEAMLEIMRRAGNVELIRKPFQMEEISRFIAANARAARISIR